jgi:Coenzyme F420-reducing hydrogenase, gamma subunit
MVTGTPCLGPVTHAGCGALCPTYDRGCYGCYGPMETPNTASLARALHAAGSSETDIVHVFRNFNANAPEFRRESKAHER